VNGAVDQGIISPRQTRTGSAPERRCMLAFADTLIDLAETKKLLLHYERRLFN
jgi:hypothetical protein